MYQYNVVQLDGKLRMQLKFQIVVEFMIDVLTYPLGGREYWTPCVFRHTLQVPRLEF